MGRRRLHLISRTVSYNVGVRGADDYLSLSTAFAVHRLSWLTRHSPSREAVNANLRSRHSGLQWTWRVEGVSNGVGQVDALLWVGGQS